MCTVVIQNGSLRIEAEAKAGQTIESLLQRFVPEFAFPCGGNHTCGKCLVTVTGAVSPVTEEEQALLPENAPQNARLACICRIMGDAAVELPSGRAAAVLSRYRLPDFLPDKKGYGFAVDIGTTTVVVQLIRRRDARVMAERMAPNVQRAFGADVISRIEACRNLGVEELSCRIVRQIEEMAAQCLRESGIAEITESVVTGNTTMLHIFEGLDPCPLAVAPFTVQSRFGQYSRRKLCGAPVYLPRCVGAYVGADIVCAACAADMKSGKTHLLADIGTNGEIMLLHEGRLTCCATAAGPAFEGAGLSCGMPAASGAIRSVYSADGRICFDTVDGEAAIGICGSGILDALAVLLHRGIMEESGYMEDTFTFPGCDVRITREDVRQLQLAKAAVCAGICTLLEENGLSSSEVEVFSLAGGFGGSIAPASAVSVGLVPGGVKDKIDFLGNAALGGAVLLLCASERRRDAFRLAEEAQELSLSVSGLFMERYIDCMSFAVVP